MGPYPNHLHFQGMAEVAAHVTAIQYQLVYARGYGLKIDGIFGPATRAAVIDWQRRKGLVQDGIVGPATWASL